MFNFLKKLLKPKYITLNKLKIKASSIIVIQDLKIGEGVSYYELLVKLQANIRREIV